MRNTRAKVAHNRRLVMFGIHNRIELIEWYVTSGLTLDEAVALSRVRTVA